MSEMTEKQPSAWHRFWRGVWLFIVWLIRLIIAIGFGVLLGAAIFYIASVGVPWFYAQVLNPIQTNSVRLDIVQSDLQNVQSDLNSSLRAAREEIRSLQKVVNEQAVIIHTLRAELDAEKANRKELLNVLQSDVRRIDETVQLQGVALAGISETVESNKAELAASLSALSEDLQVTSAQVVTVTADVASLQEGIAKIENRVLVGEKAIAKLSQDAESLQESLTSLETEVIGIRDVITMPIKLSDAFERRLVLMQAWQGILKARLHLLEKNAGYASQALQLAQDNVARFVALSTDLTAAQLEPITKRAETASALIESDPFTAIQELEIIWHSLEQLISPPVAATAASSE